MEISDPINPRGYSMESGETPVEELYIKADSLVVETSFGDISLLNPENELTVPLEEDFRSGGTVVLNQGSDSISGFKILPPGAREVEWEFTLPKNSNLSIGEDGGVDDQFYSPNERVITLKSFIESP